MIGQHAALLVGLLGRAGGDSASAGDALETLLAGMEPNSFKRVSSTGTGGKIQDVRPALNKANFDALTVRTALSLDTTGLSSTWDTDDDVGTIGVGGDTAYSAPEIDDSGNVAYLCPGGHTDGHRQGITFFDILAACQSINEGGDGGVWVQKQPPASLRLVADGAPTGQPQQIANGGLYYADVNTNGVLMPICTHSYYCPKYLGDGKWLIAGWSAYCPNPGDGIGGIWVWDSVTNTVTMRKEDGANTWDGPAEYGGGGGPLPTAWSSFDDCIYTWGASFNEFVRWSNIKSGTVTRTALTASGVSQSAAAYRACTVNNPADPTKKAMFLHAFDSHASWEHTLITGIEGSTATFHEDTYANDPSAVFARADNGYRALYDGGDDVYAWAHEGEIYRFNVSKGVGNIDVEIISADATGDVPEWPTGDVDESLPRGRYLPDYNCHILASYEAGVVVYKPAA